MRRPGAAVPVPARSGERGALQAGILFPLMLFARAGRMGLGFRAELRVAVGDHLLADAVRPGKRQRPMPAVRIREA